jgi:hypothetical protein
MHPNIKVKTASQLADRVWIRLVVGATDLVSVELTTYLASLEIIVSKVRKCLYSTFLE